jgi:hypothetical protein
LKVVSVDTERKPAGGVVLGVGVGVTPAPVPDPPVLGVGVGLLPTPEPDPPLPVGVGGATLPTLSGPEPPHAAKASSGNAITIE